MGSTESLAFELKLVDAVTAPGKRAADALRAVQASAEKAQGALNFGKERGRIEQNLKKLSADPKGYVHLVKAQKDLKEQRNKLLEDAGIKKPESFMAGLTSKFSFAKIASSAAVGELMAEGALKVGEALLEGAKAAVDILADGVKDAFKDAGHERTRRIGEKLSLGEQGGKEFREDVERFSDKTGFNPSEIRGLMLPMRRAGFTQASSRQALATATDIAAGQGKGGDAEAVGGILEQFQHLKTKGGIGKKQLVELLGGSGDTIPQFYKELGAKLKVSAKEAEKMAEEGGKIDPQLMMNMITASVNRKQGGAAGTGGAEYGKSFEALFHKLGGLQERYFEKLVESPGFKKAEELMGSLLERLNPESPDGRRIMSAIEGMFEKLTGIIGDPADAADAIASGLENAATFAADIIPDLKVMGGMLVKAADAAADMVFQLRLAKAYGSLDFEEVDKIKREGANRIVEKKARELEKYTEHQRASRLTEEQVGRQINDGGDPMVAMMVTAIREMGGKETKDKPGESGKTEINVNLVGDHSDEAKSRKHGRAAGKAAARELERARQKRGG